jgi:GAF domain-containing protein
MGKFSEHGFEATDFSVLVSDLLVATSDSADASIDAAVPEVLTLLRQKLKMDVVFVSEFVGGKRVFRHVESGAGAPQLPVGYSNPLEESYCQRVVDGRLPEIMPDASAHPGTQSLPKPPFRVGAHLSTPIMLGNGQAYGTLCCFSTQPNPMLQQRDLDNLRHCAKLVARKVEIARERKADPDWALKPMEDGGRA